MIKIGKGYLHKSEGKMLLCSDVSIDQRVFKLWFLVDEKWGGCLGIGRADALLMALLPTAMRAGHEIQCEDAISDKLRFKLKEYLIPALAMEEDNHFYQLVQIRAPLTKERYPNLGAVGAGFSDDDYFRYTAICHGQKSEYPLSHVSVFNIGNSEYDKGSDGLKKTIRKAEDFAQKHNLEMLYVDTNFDEVLHENFEQVSTFRKLACVLAVQGLFSVYLFPTSSYAGEFRLDINYCVSYDLLSTNCASTEALAIYPSGIELDLNKKRQKIEKGVEEPKKKENEHVIKIGKPYIEEDHNETRLCTKVIMHNQEQVLWISVKKEYQTYLVDDRLDAFVVVLLAKAMREKADVICEAPVTRRLLYQINQYLIPMMSSNTDEYYHISIHAISTDKRLENWGGVVSGWTGGVDSMFTLLRNFQEPKDSAHKLTHLMVTNNGAIEGTGSSNTFRKMIEKAENGIIPETGFQMIGIDSNFQEALQEHFIAIHTLRYAAVILALQKLFSVFLHSAGYAFSSLSLEAKEIAYYELVVLNCFETDNTVLYSSGGAFSRLQKVVQLSDFPLAYQYIHPCIYALSDNCGECKKCYSLEAALYAIGKLDLFSAVFDVERFKKEKDRYFSEILLRKNESTCGGIVALCQQYKVNLFVAKCRAFFKRANKKLQKLRQSLGSIIK